MKIGSIGWMIIYCGGAFLIGAFGSGAYLLLVKLGFAGGRTPKERKKMLAPFKEYFPLYPFLYCAGGGMMAVIFQMITKVFVPIQALLMGITWPIFISSWISGRQAELNKEEKQPTPSEIIGISKSLPAELGPISEEVGLKRLVDKRDYLGPENSDTLSMLPVTVENELKKIIDKNE